jgi:DNA polymerase I
MIRIRDTLAGDRISFHCPESTKDLYEVRDFILNHEWLAFDTESTGLNCYHPKWRMRTVQFGDKSRAYVVPQQYRRFIGWAFRQSVKWIGHNGLFDFRCVDVHLGYDTGSLLVGETRLPMHYQDPRNRDQGGVGHKLKDWSIAYIDKEAGKWEHTLVKEAFAEIKVRIPGEFYKTSNKARGYQKGDPKYRKIHQAEGWRHVNPMDPRYIAYAGSDPILTYRAWWDHLLPWVKEFKHLYKFDKRVDLGLDRLQRKAIRLDVNYTQRLNKTYERKAVDYRALAAEYGCKNIQSGQQVGDTLIELGADLRERTENGQYKTDAELLRKIMLDPRSNEDVVNFINYVLVAKQLEKRKENYTQKMLDERDINDRVHTSINGLAARTTRMSASNPAFQQLPTKDHEDEIIGEVV